MDNVSRSRTLAPGETNDLSAARLKSTFQAACSNSSFLFHWSVCPSSMQPIRTVKAWKELEVLIPQSRA